MTELNSFQSVGALPVWALPNAPDMMEWKWQPPKPELWSPSPLPPPSPSPQPRLAIAVPVLAPLPEPEAVLQPPLQPDPFEVTIVEEHKPPSAWQRFLDQLHDIRINHVHSHAAYNNSFKDFISCFERALSEGELTSSAAADIYLKAVRSTEIVERRYPTSASRLRYSLTSSLATGVKHANEAGHIVIVPSSDLYMLHIAQHKAHVHSADLLAFAMNHLRSRHGREYYDLVSEVLHRFFDLWRGAEVHGTPEHWNWPEISQTSRLASTWAGRTHQILLTVEALLATGQVQEACFRFAGAQRAFSRGQRFTLKVASLMSDDSIIAEKIASAIEAKDPRGREVLVTQGTRLLGYPGTSWSRAHYNWLQVVARLPKISTRQFKILLELCAPRGLAALSHTELCNLLLLHWESNGKIKPGSKIRHVWNGCRGHDDRCVLAALALAVNKTTSPKSCTAIFWGLWSIMRRRVGPRAFLQQLALLSKRKVLSSGFLKRLAWTSNDLRVIWRIHGVLVKQRGQDINFWWPPFWDKFVVRIKHRWKYPLIDPIKLITKLLAPDPDLRPLQPPPVKLVEHHYHENSSRAETQPLDEQINLYRSFTPLDPGKKEDTSRPRLLNKQIERLKMGLELLRDTRGISDRQALHGVTKVTVVLANTQGYLTARDLAPLTSVIMRTLNKGQCGSKERFKWYLGVIYRFLGKDAYVRVGLIIKHRRLANWLTWRKRLARTVGVARQTRDFAQPLIEAQLPKHPRASSIPRYVDRGKRTVKRVRKLDGYRKVRRRTSIVLSHSKVDVRKAVGESITEVADTPLDRPKPQTIKHDLASDGRRGWPL